MVKQETSSELTDCDHARVFPAKLRASFTSWVNLTVNDPLITGAQC